MRTLHDLQAIRRELHLLDDRPLQQANGIACNRVAITRREFFRDRSTAHNRRTLQHDDAVSRSREIERAHESVVTSADDGDIEMIAARRTAVRGPVVDGMCTIASLFRADAQSRMDTRDGFVDAVGNTPLIKLRKASELTGCTILGKAEFLNPGGSVKDRAALYMILDAEQRGVLGPGGTIVEGTAGNTGIGLALVGNARGYRTVIVIPETQSQEKKDMLRLCGAELREVPAVPYKDPDNYVHVVRARCRELAATEPPARSGPTSGTTPPTATATPLAPARDLGADRRHGRRFHLRRRHRRHARRRSDLSQGANPDIVTAAADPMGAAMYSWFKPASSSPRAAPSPRASARAGSPATSTARPIDDAFQIPDEESAARRLRPAPRGGAVPRRVERHQRRGRYTACQRARARQDDRYRALRLGFALPIETF